MKASKWYEILITTNNELIEPVNNILTDFGVYGIVIENEENLLDQAGNNWDYIDTEPTDTKKPIVIRGFITFEDTSNCIYTDFSNLRNLKGEKNRDLQDKDFSFDKWILELEEKIHKLSDFGFNTSTTSLTYNNFFAKDYNEEWKKNFKPFWATNNIFIAPSWESEEDIFAELSTREDSLLVNIDPQMAFGTGTHESTALAILLLEEFIPVSDKKILYDIGCGSGILSIVASLLGVKEVVGIDIEEKSIESSLNNLSLNKRARATFLLGNLLDKCDKKADIVVANLVFDLIVNISKQVYDILEMGGFFISSGILLSKEKETRIELERHGFKIVKFVKRGEWCAFVAKKQE